MASSSIRAGVGEVVELPPILPTGKHTIRNTPQQQRGIWLHALLQNLTTNSLSLRGITGDLAADIGQPGRMASSSIRVGVGEQASNNAELQHRLAIPSTEIDNLLHQAQHLITSPRLARFFDAQQYRRASNEMPYINAKGELKRIDRIVEFDDEVWVLDYKLGVSEDAVRYRAQMLEYRTAMQTVYAGKEVRCALVFADGELGEVG
jgi:ATP-dependent helicase/nuclease subunit A